jgi:mannose-P-dolichol utilization defect protein 1
VQGLGTGIVVGSTLVKVPQVLKVVRSKSAAGLNALSFELETLGLAIAATYGFMLALPFTAFGEVVALLLQNIVLLACIYRYQRLSSRRSVIAILLLVAWTILATSGTLSRAHISALYDFNNLILIASRVPQISQNFQHKSTGQLSPITYGLNTAGSAARIFTAVHEHAGPAMLRGAVISTLLNGVMVTQMAMYAAPSRDKKD